MSELDVKQVAAALSYLAMFIHFTWGPIWCNE